MAKFRRGKKVIDLDPAHILVFGFAGIIFIGTILFMLPISTKSGHSLHFIDALFEATSAVCVTGLAVVDTGQTFSTFGQIVLLVLIQIGGWGFMTVAVMMFLVAGKRIGLRERLLLQDALNSFSIQGVIKLVLRIITITLIIELVGMIVLTIRWSFEMPLTRAIYYAVFHSISAFNNAGFGLEADSLSKWVGDPTINIVITFLFITGGIGFPVILDVWEKKSIRRLTFHSKVVLVVTLIVNIVGTFVIFISEYYNPHTIANFSLSDKLWASYFQGVVPRTAGFNTIDIGQMTLPSLVFTMCMMFVGASSASTGGGIKVTTFSLILFAVWSILTNKEDVTIFKRRIPWDLINKSFSIGITAILFIFVIFFLLTYTEKADMLHLLFETVSAFGTVGLSADLTPTLSPIGRIFITIMMFIGRLGPLTMAFALISNRRKSTIKYAEDKILIG